MRQLWDTLCKGAYSLWTMLSSLLSKIMLALIWFYRHCISPLKPPSCRYTPTCSQYAVNNNEIFIFIQLKVPNIC